MNVFDFFKPPPPVTVALANLLEHLARGEPIPNAWMRENAPDGSLADAWAGAQSAALLLVVIARIAPRADFIRALSAAARSAIDTLPDGGVPAQTLDAVDAWCRGEMNAERLGREAEANTRLTYELTHEARGSERFVAHAIDHVVRAAREPDTLEEDSIECVMVCVYDAHAAGATSSEARLALYSEARRRMVSAVQGIFAPPTIDALVSAPRIATASAESERLQRKIALRR